MKAYIKEVNWADEGDIFMFSLEYEENLKVMNDLINLYSDLDLFPEYIEIYWGTNECFYFHVEDLLDFVEDAKDISEEELKVFKKFEVSGFDIYDRICDLLYDTLCEAKSLNENELLRLKPLFLKLFEEEDWNRAINFDS